MGQNSTEVAYGFGQLGSAYADVANIIVPPVGHVIVAIQFLADNTPTLLTPEKLTTVTGSAGAGSGPSYVSIAGTGNVVLATAESDQNFRGVHASAITDVAAATTGLAGTELTLTTVAPTGTVKVGQYVLLANTAADNDGSTPMVLDVSTSDGCPIPIYSGPNQAGVRVTSHSATNKVTLDANITASTQSLIFLDEHHGAGGLTAASQVFPMGLTIYGRWTAFKPSAAGVICYFGK
jgi:hypothetical protein